MKHELQVATKNWDLAPVEAKMLIDRTLDLLDRKDIGNNRMSPYQLEHFVLDEEHPTDWGKYKQAIAELETRIGVLLSDHIQHRQAQARQRRALWWAAVLRPWRWLTLVDTYYEERLAAAQQQEVTFRQLERHIEHCLLELRIFEGKAQQFKDVFGDKDVVQLETEYWEARKAYFEKKAFETVAKNVAHLRFAQQLVQDELTKNGRRA